MTAVIKCLNVSLGNFFIHYHTHSIILFQPVVNLFGSVIVIAAGKVLQCLLADLQVSEFSVYIQSDIFNMKF